MIRNIALLAIFSFVVVFWAHASAGVIQVIHHAFNQVSSLFGINVGGYQMGSMPRHIIALFAISLVTGLFLQLLLWLMKKSNPGFVTGVTWGVWLVLSTILLMKG